MASRRVCGRVRALGRVLLLSGILPVAASAQNAPTIRRSTSLVLVPVSVLDKSERFVTNLDAKDFRVFVDGKPVDVSHFDVVTEASAQAENKTTAEPVLPPNTFRNISAVTGSQSNLVILLVDYLNTRAADRIALRDELLKYFSTKLQPGQEIAVYGLTYRLALLQPFTRDSRQLSATAKNLLKQKGQPVDPTVGKPLFRPGLDSPTGLSQGEANEFLELRNARIAYNMDQVQRVARTLAAFRQLAHSFEGIPGKKTVVWLTGDASPLNPSMLYRILVNDIGAETPGPNWWETAKTYEALNAAGVSVFPTDVRGITNAGLLKAGETQAHSEFVGDVGGAMPRDGSPYASTTDLRLGEASNATLAMDSMAAETGGTVLAGSNDIGKLLERANKLWASYYVLAFVPEKSANESVASYHKIQVKVGRPGVHVLARRGYVTRPEAYLSSEPEIQRDLAEAAVSPIDLTSVSLRIDLGETDHEGSNRIVPFVLVISGAVLGTAAEKGVPYDLSIAELILDQDGKIVRGPGARIRDVVPASEAGEVVAKGLKYESAFDAPPGSGYYGRVVVRDNLSGRVGTMTLALPNTP